jgi:hypothetical protein
VQALLSVAWVVVVFAAVIAYVEPRFRTVREAVEANKDTGEVSWEHDPDASGFLNGLRALPEGFADMLHNAAKRLHFRRARPTAPENSEQSATEEDSREDSLELPDEDTSGVAVSFPYIEIDKISLELNNNRVKLTAALENSNLWFTRDDIVVSTGPRPARSLESLRRFVNRQPRRARQFTVILPVTEGLTDWGYQVSGNYFHVVLKGLSALPNRSEITTIVSS